MNTPLPSSFESDPDFHEEKRLQKLGRKLREEPLIPFGCALTCWALWNAAKSVRSGDHHGANKMFRARIYAQGFTLVCLVGGSYYYAEDRSRRKVFDGAVAQKKAQEKNEAWIRELEARDREAKEEEKMARERRNRSKREKGISTSSEIEAAKGFGQTRSTLEAEEHQSIIIFEALKLWRR